MFDLLKYKDSTAIISDAGKTMTYAQMQEAADGLKPFMQKILDK